MIDIDPQDKEELQLNAIAALVVTILLFGGLGLFCLAIYLIVHGAWFWSLPIWFLFVFVGLFITLCSQGGLR